MSTPALSSDKDQPSTKKFTVTETLDDDGNDDDATDTDNNDGDNDTDSYDEDEDIDLEQVEKKLFQTASSYFPSHHHDYNGSRSTGSNDSNDNHHHSSTMDPNEIDSEPFRTSSNSRYDSSRTGVSHHHHSHNSPPSDPQYDLYDARTGNYIRQRHTGTSSSSFTTTTTATTTTAIAHGSSTANRSSTTSSVSNPNNNTKTTTKTPPPTTTTTNHHHRSASSTTNPQKKAELQRLQKQAEMMGSLITLTGSILIVTLLIVVLGNNQYIPSSWFSLPFSSSFSSGRSGSSYHQPHHHDHYTTSSGQVYPVKGKYYEESTHPSGRKLQDTELFVKVTMEQLYQQSVMNITYGHTILCTSCHGMGGTGVRTCPHCHGQGIQMYIHRMGNMIQQVQRHCDVCHGEGRIIDHVCDKCHGKGKHYETLTVPIRLSAGIQDGDIIRVPKYGDQHRDVGYGDLRIRIDESALPKWSPKTVTKPKNNQKNQMHSSSPSSLSQSRQRDTNIYAFQRRKLGNDPRTIRTRTDDLQGTIKLTLQEALFGFNRSYTHPGNPSYIFHVASAVPVQPGEILILKNAGMPRRSIDALQHQQTMDDGRIVEQQQASKDTNNESFPSAYTVTEYGDAYFEVQIQLPDSLTREEEEMVRRVF